MVSRELKDWCVLGLRQYFYSRKFSKTIKTFSLSSRASRHLEGYLFLTHKKSWRKSSQLGPGTLKTSCKLP